MKLDFYLNCHGDCEEALRFYERELGGQIFMKMATTPFANRFAMLRDRFGISWMLLQGVAGAP